MKKTSIIFKQKIYINNNKTQNTVFLDMQLKSGFSVERECYIYTIYLYLCPPVPLSKYIQWRAMKRGGRGGTRAVEGCYNPFHISELYQIYAKYCWKIFPNTVLTVNRDSLNKQLSSILVKVIIFSIFEGDAPAMLLKMNFF